MLNLFSDGRMEETSKAKSAAERIQRGKQAELETNCGPLAETLSKIKDICEPKALDAERSIYFSYEDYRVVYEEIYHYSNFRIIKLNGFFKTKETCIFSGQVGYNWSRVFENKLDYWFTNLEINMAYKEAIERIHREMYEYIISKEEEKIKNIIIETAMISVNMNF